MATTRASSRLDRVGGFARSGSMGFPEGDPKTDAPVEARYFRRWFDLPEEFKIKRAELFISADDKFTAWVNSKPAGSGSDWRYWTGLDVRRLLRSGTNLLAIKAENESPGAKPNPAGLLARLEIESESGSLLAVVTDSEWRASRPITGAWAEPAFNDTDWPRAAVLAKYGEGPWGKLSSLDELVEPFVATVNKSVLAYLADPRPVIVHHLQPHAVYRATIFDPVEGRKEAVRELKTGDDSDLRLEPPAAGHDWAVLLEKAQD